jgi:hypothetical protein
MLYMIEEQPILAAFILAPLRNYGDVFNLSSTFGLALKKVKTVTTSANGLRFEEALDITWRESAVKDAHVAAQYLPARVWR